MKNLKRILSLALASVMVMGMMVVGASAAFNDQAEINANNVDAVNTMVSLKILSGKEGGKFDPKGGVTRAEMATMIAMSLNGGNADFRGTTTTGFTDVDGIVSIKWAAKFIKYCVDQGILSGVGNNKFNPNANVTAQEAATMILTAMGYKKEMLKSETSDWAAKINLKAEQRKLYDDTKVVDYTQDVDRETAAQMVFNGITVGTPDISDTYNVTTGEHEYSVRGEATKDSILKSAFKADMKYAVMEGISYNTANKQYTYTLSGTKAGGDTTTQLPAADSALTSAEDYADLYLKRVRVLYNDANNSIIAINKVGESVLSSGAIGDLEFKDGKLDGKDFNTGIKMYDFGTDVTTGSNGTTLATDTDITTARGANSVCSKYELVDYNVDGKADAAILYPVAVATVSYIGKDYVNAGGNRSEKQYDYPELAEDDVVMVTAPLTALNRKGALEKLELVEMTFNGYQDGKYRSSGEWYTDVATGVANIDVDNPAARTWKAAVVNGYIVARQAVEAAATAGNAVIVAAADNSITNANAVKGTPTFMTIRVMDLDGEYTNLDVTMAKMGSATTATTVTNGCIVAHDLITFAEDPDNAGYYIATSYAKPANTFEKKDSAEIVVKDGKISGGDNSDKYNILAEGKFFVSATVNSKEVLKVVTGADIAKWGYAYQTATSAKNVVYASTVNGFKTANLGVLVLNKVDLNDDGDFADAGENVIATFPGAVSNKILAWTTSDAVFTADTATGTTYLEVTVWDGEAERSISVTSADFNDGNGVVGITAKAQADAWTKGAPVTFLENGNGYATSLTLVNGGVSGAVSAWDGKYAQFNGVTNTYTIDDDWTVLYVDTAENKGVDGGAIAIARKDALGNNVDNVYVDTTDKLLVVDITNQVDGLAGVSDITVSAPVSDLDTTARTVKIARGTQVSGLNGKITVAASFKVVKADGTDAAATDTIVAGWTLRIAALDGTVIDLAIALQ